MFINFSNWQTMKKIFTLFVILICSFGFSQNTSTTVVTKELFPELFQMKLTIDIPKIQFVPEKELYMKEKKLILENGVGYHITFKDKSVFVGSIQSNYGGHEKTVSVSFGKMDFSNGDRYKGHFY